MTAEGVQCTCSRQIYIFVESLKIFTIFRDAQIFGFPFSIHFSYLVDSHFQRRFITRFCIGGPPDQESINPRLAAWARAFDIHSIVFRRALYRAFVLYGCRNGNLIRQNKSSSLWGLRDPVEGEVAS